MQMRLVDFNVQCCELFSENRSVLMVLGILVNADEACRL